MVRGRSSALGVMVKAPRAGEVKTRLVPPLTLLEAAGLYEAFLKDISLRLKSLSDIDIHIFLTPNNAEVELSVVFEGYSSFIPQSSGNLGDRLKSAFDILFSKGYEDVAIIGSDSPDLPLEYIEETFSRLKSKEVEVVLGPAKDGGYYLVAMRGRHYSIFNDINWSTPGVLDETLKRAKADDIKTVLLKEWYDIDTVEDLALIKGSVEAVFTSEFLEALK